MQVLLIDLLALNETRNCKLYKTLKFLHPFLGQSYRAVLYYNPIKILFDSFNRFTKWWKHVFVQVTFVFTQDYAFVILRMCGQHSFRSRSNAAAIERREVGTSSRCLMWDVIIV